VFIEIDEFSNKVSSTKDAQNVNKQANYKEVLFNYKDYNVPEVTNGLKRKNVNPLELLDLRINKKQEWIKKEKTTKDNANNFPINNFPVRREVVSNENTCIVAINEEGRNDDNMSSQALSLESNLNSKAKLDNFQKKVDYSNFNTNLIKVKAKDKPLVSKNDYDLELKTFEEQDNSFFEVKTKQNQSRVSNNGWKKTSTGSTVEPKMINYRNKKDREKLQGYRCEICQNVSRQLTP
jgi:hypothetical protein